MESTTFNVPSISCSTCSGKIQSGIKEMNGIENVSVDLKTQMVTVEYNPDNVSAQDIRKKISTLGYEVIQ
ncbi:MAG: heavy-metal-associated domain-containing protein [Clostridia bacterium]|nr:heavy-metal-associated domain-containing protein [Clostridia bacterium]